jgi:cation-transporting ATPase 13A1
VDLVRHHGGGEALPWPPLRVMAGCHSLATMGTGSSKYNPISVVGDPLEQTVLKETGYQLIGSDTVALSGDNTLPGTGARAIRILHRFAFSSKLKRMTTLVTEGGSDGVVLTLSKGAPETIKELLAVVPSHYDETANFHMGRGRRVLAMAYGDAGELRDIQKLKGLGRDYFERSLVFAGFLVLDCPLKSDSRTVITELRRSGHAVVMCTGDALLTAVEVARQVSIVKKKHVVYNIQPLRTSASKLPSDPLSSFECVPLTDGSETRDSVALSSKSIAALSSMRDKASFCISGDILAKIANASLQHELSKGHRDEKHVLLHPDAQAVLAKLVPLISVFARHAPHQKEAVIAAFNCSGHCTMMCGGKHYSRLWLWRLFRCAS